MIVYIGLDIHKKFSVAIAMNETGQVLRRDRIEHGASIARAPWRQYFASFDEPPHVALEATSVSHAVCEAIEPLCASLVMAHPLKTKLIAEQKVKTDTIDGTALAHLRRTDFLPTAYIAPKPIRDQRELLRHRVCLVRVQTILKNRMHSLLARCGEFYVGTDLFGATGRRYLAALPLREPYRAQLDRWLCLLDGMAAQIKEVTTQIRRAVKMTPDVERLTTVPGIGDFLAALIYWEIGDIRRFHSPSKLVGYCGLAPRVYSSGGKTWHGAITKEGNRFLRWAFVQAVQKYGVRAGALGDAFRRLKGKHGSASAKVAMARKLAVITWHMLSRGEEFDETRVCRKEVLTQRFG